METKNDFKTVSKPVYERMVREHLEAMDWLIRIQMQQRWDDLGKWLDDNGIFWGETDDLAENEGGDQ